MEKGDGNSQAGESEDNMKHVLTDILTEYMHRELDAESGEQTRKDPSRHMKQKKKKRSLKDMSSHKHRGKRKRHVGPHDSGGLQRLISTGK